MRQILLAFFMDDIVVSNEGATKFLKGLNPSKALGSDEFHPRWGSGWGLLTTDKWSYFLLTTDFWPKILLTTDFSAVEFND